MNSVITNNQSSGDPLGADGGGIYNSGTLTLTNSTVSGNIVSGSTFSDGGGLANGPNTRVTLINSTVSGNTSSGLGGGISNWGNQV
jgi:hypothetical protein